MSATPPVRIRRAELNGRLVDITISPASAPGPDGRGRNTVGPKTVITAIEPHRSGTGTPHGVGTTGGQEFDAAGGAVIPGLHDHHIHLLALAAARTSLDISSLDRRDALRRIGDRARRSAGGWLRVVGLHDRHESGQPWDAAVLDVVAPGARIRVQHRSGAMWVLSSAAMADIGLHTGSLAPMLGSHGSADAGGAPTGRWYGIDALIRERVPHAPVDLISLGRELSAYGITGVTDATPSDRPEDFALLAAAARTKGFPTVQVTGAATIRDHPHPLLVGPVKLLPADHHEFDLAAITREIDRAHRAGRSVAIHCVSRAGLVVALAAWEDAGAMAGDRVEHGGIIDPDSLERIAQLELTVVTQPNFIAERGDDYRRDVDCDDQGYLYRCGTLLERGVPVAGSTDAPFGHPDPWRAIAAAVDRRTASGEILGRNEQLSAVRALGLFLSPLDEPSGPPRAVEVGAGADLCVLATPMEQALAAPRHARVAATVRDGRLSAWDVNASNGNAARH